MEPIARSGYVPTIGTRFEPAARNIDNNGPTTSPHFRLAARSRKAASARIQNKIVRGHRRIGTPRHLRQSKRPHHRRVPELLWLGPEMVPGPKIATEARYTDFYTEKDPELVQGR